LTLFRRSSKKPIYAISKINLDRGPLSHDDQTDHVTRRFDEFSALKASGRTSAEIAV
jgi:hypothetical protein